MAVKVLGDLGVGAVAFAVLMFAAVLSYARPWGPVRRSVLIAGRVCSIELVGVNNRFPPPFEAKAVRELRSRTAASFAL